MTTTRQKQIEEAADRPDLLGGDPLGRIRASGFVDGAQWADQNSSAEVLALVDSTEEALNRFGDDHPIWHRMANALEAWNKRGEK